MLIIKAFKERERISKYIPDNENNFLLIFKINNPQIGNKPTSYFLLFIDHISIININKCGWMVSL